LKLSTKGRYGLRVILDIAQHQAEGPVTIRSIAQRQEISERYLEQHLINLKKSGLIKSIRGSQGGYFLNKASEEITVGDIVRSLEGPIVPVDCVQDDSTASCSRADSCVTRKVWQDLKKAMNEVLDSYTLADLLQESKKIQENSCDNYFI
jgi:Rrf2 family protein